MQLLKTSFALRSDLRWSDVYECVYAWISESENRKNHRKNYADLLKELPLPQEISFGRLLGKLSPRKTKASNAARFRSTALIIRRSSLPTGTTVARGKFSRRSSAQRKMSGVSFL